MLSGSTFMWCHFWTLTDPLLRLSVALGLVEPFALGQDCKTPIELLKRSSLDLRKSRGRSKLTMNILIDTRRQTDGGVRVDFPSVQTVKLTTRKADSNSKQNFSWNMMQASRKERENIHKEQHAESVATSRHMVRHLGQRRSTSWPKLYAELQRFVGSGNARQR